MSFEINLDFSSISFPDLLEFLENGLPDVALEQLSSLLLYGDNELFKDMPITKFSQLITNFFSDPNSDLPIKTLAGMCIHGLIEAHPMAAREFEKSKVLKAVGKYLTNDLNSNGLIELASQCIQILSTISVQCPNAIFEQCGFEPLLKNIRFLSNIDQKTAIKTLDHITNFPFHVETVCLHLDKICELFTHQEQVVVHHAIKAFSNIASVCDLDSVPISVIQKVCNILETIVDGTAVYHLIKSLERFALNNKLAQEIINQNLNFEQILNQTKAKGKFMDLLQSCLTALAMLVPPHKHFEKPIIDRQLENSINYAISFENFIVNLILNKIGCVPLCLQIIASISQYQMPAKIDEIMRLLTMYSTQPELIKSVLVVLCNFKEQQCIQNSQILSILKTMKISDDENLKQFYDDLITIGIDKAEPIKEISKIDNLQVFTDVVKQEPFIFIIANGIERCTEFLTQFYQEKNSNTNSLIEMTSEFRETLQCLVLICHELISFYPIPDEVDPLEDPGDTRRLMKKVLRINVKCGETLVSDINAELSLDFAAVENWFNLRNGLTPDDLVQAIRADPQFSQMISETENSAGGNTRGAILNRAFKNPKYQKYNFKINDKTFSVHESIFQAYCSLNKDFNTFLMNIPTIELIPSDNDVERSKYEIRVIPFPPIDPILHLLEVIHKIDPKLDITCEAFSNHLLPHLASPILTIGHLSLATSIIYHYPFLFPLNMRLLFCKLTAFDVPYALYTINQKFVETSDNTKFEQVRVKVKINRNNIFNDGVLTLERLGPGRCYFDVFFEGETGIGNGPTQEFFYLFSKELCRKSRKIWRCDNFDDSSDNNSNDQVINDGNNRSDKVDRDGENEDAYAYSPKGLFPRPDIDPHMSYILGLMCSKAFSMGCMIRIQINPAFFSFLRGEKVAISDIDEQLAKSLECKEGLYDLPFVYPGIPTLELKENGKDIFVDETNVDEYVSLVEAYTCGDKLSEIITQFKKGFQSVIAWEAINIFTSEEFSRLLYGENIKLTVEDFFSNVEISHGYNINSPQIQYLFEVLSELNSNDLMNFFQFMTGSRMMPVGGLEQLRPKMTVAARTDFKNCSPDEYLPSVMTCVNYLKLPMYSSKEILRKQLMTAINEGRYSFEFT